MKGISIVRAYAPEGREVFEIEGKALEVRSDRVSTSQHWSIHEKTIQQPDPYTGQPVGALVGIIPMTWALEFVLNDAS